LEEHSNTEEAKDCPEASEQEQQPGEISEAKTCREGIYTEKTDITHMTSKDQIKIIFFHFCICQN